MTFSLLLGCCKGLTLKLTYPIQGCKFFPLNLPMCVSGFTQTGVKLARLFNEIVNTRT